MFVTSVILELMDKNKIFLSPLKFLLKDEEDGSHIAFNLQIGIFNDNILL